MTIGSDPLHNDSFDRADGPIGGAYQIFGQYDAIDVEPETDFAISGNAAILSAGAGSLGWKTARIDSGLFGAANYAVEFAVNETGGASPIGVMVHMSAPSGPLFDAYFIGKAGTLWYISRVINGVATDLDSDYVAIFDSPGPYHMKAEIDDDGSGNPVIRVYTAASEGGEYTLRGTVTDTAEEKITATGTAAITVQTFYNPENIKSWLYFKVTGTSTGGNEGAMAAAESGSDTATITGGVAVTGGLAATEVGSDTFEGIGPIPNYGLRLQLRDTDTGELIANEAALIWSARATARGVELVGGDAGTTDADGWFVVDDDLVGTTVGLLRRLTIERSDESRIGTFYASVVNLNS